MLPQIERITAEEVDAEALQAVIDAFAGLSGRLLPEVELIISRLGDEPTQAQINKATAQIQNLLFEELDDFAGYLNTTLPQYEQQAFQLGATQAILLMTLLFSSTGVDQDPQSADGTDVLGQMLAPGSPLHTRLQMYGEYHAEQIANELKRILSSGIGARPGARAIAEIIRLVELAIANPLADALRLTRTALLYAQRESTRLNYIANSDVVTGWQWFASLDDRVCPVCATKHGTVYTLDETLNGHHNCRCVMIPIVGEPVIDENAGILWFESLSEAQQRSLLGIGKYEAWKSGKIKLPDIIGVREDEVYGSMVKEKSLRELLE